MNQFRPVGQEGPVHNWLQPVTTSFYNNKTHFNYSDTIFILIGLNLSLAITLIVAFLLPIPIITTTVITADVAAEQSLLLAASEKQCKNDNHIS
jgi:hypothetical protein